MVGENAASWQHFGFRSFFFSTYLLQGLAEKQKNTASLPHNPRPLLHNVILNRFDPKPTTKERRYNSHTPYGLVLTIGTFPFATKYSHPRNLHTSK